MQKNKNDKNKKIKRVTRAAIRKLDKISKKGTPAKGLKQSMNRSQGYPRNYNPNKTVYVNDNPTRENQKAIDDTTEPSRSQTSEAWHRDMQAPRDNGFRPHVPRSLIKEPDVEGYSRNLLLQPYQNVWDEPKKESVWDEKVKKKKSIFE